MISIIYSINIYLKKEQTDPTEKGCSIWHASQEWASSDLNNWLPFKMGKSDISQEAKMESEFE